MCENSMVIRYSIKELSAKDGVNRPMKYKARYLTRKIYPFQIISTPWI